MTINAMKLIETNEVFITMPLVSNGNLAVSHNRNRGKAYDTENKRSVF